MTKKITLPTLKKSNLILAFLHAAQAVAVIVLAKPEKGLSPITTNYLSLDNKTNTLHQATRHLGDVNLAWIVVIFFALSAVFHLSIATFYNKKYEEGLKKEVNRARWFEYSLSASVMMLGVAYLSGISDISSLIMIFALTAGMNLMGLIMETHQIDKSRPNWASFWIGSGLGIVPWIVFGIYLWGAQALGSGVPGFVYGIYASIFVFFNCFALNMWLQYKKKGKWTDYLYGERMYMILSLVAKSALAWQIFAGTLRP